MIKDNKNPIILLDLDDTITKFLPTTIAEYNKIYNTNHSIDEITEWVIPKHFEHDLFSVLQKTDVLERIPLKEGAYETIEKWYNKGYEIVIVTAVNGCVSSYVQKIKWLHNVGLNKFIKDVIPTNNKYLINGDILIDDNPNNLDSWSSHHDSKVVLPLLMDANHNKQNTKYTRVDSWKMIDKVVSYWFSDSDCEELLNIFETRLDYLFRYYECTDRLLLKSRCPVNIDSMDLSKPITKDFKDMIDRIERAEDEIISRIIESRDNDKTRYSFEEVKKYIEERKNK